MDKKRIKELGLTQSGKERRTFLRLTGVALGTGLGFLGLSTMEKILGNPEKIGIFLEGEIKKREVKTFERIQKYQSGTRKHIAKPYDSYAREISKDIQEYPFLNEFDGSNLRGFYRNFLNKGEDMKIGHAYKLPIWKKE